jgi:hypothetical protein
LHYKITVISQTLNERNNITLGGTGDVEVAVYEHEPVEAVVVGNETVVQLAVVAVELVGFVEFAEAVEAAVVLLAAFWQT